MRLWLALPGYRTTTHAEALALSLSLFLSSYRYTHRMAAEWGGRREVADAAARTTSWSSLSLPGVNSAGVRWSSDGSILSSGERERERETERERERRLARLSRSRQRRSSSSLLIALSPARSDLRLSAALLSLSSRLSLFARTSLYMRQYIVFRLCEFMASTGREWIFERCVIEFRTDL